MFASPYPTDPAWGALAQTIGTGLFGDPEAAAAAQLQRAKIAQLQASAGYDQSRTADQELRTGVRTGLPAMFEELAPRARQAPPETLDGFLSPEYQPRPAETEEDAYRRAAPGIAAAIAQMNETNDPTKVLGSLAAFMGGDSLARRGIIAQGNTPGASFAVDAGRADQIAEQGYNKDRDVARINHESDIPVANVQAAASRYGSDNTAASSRYNTDVDSGDNRYRTDQSVGVARYKVDAENGRAPVADTAAVVRSVWPQARITQTARDPNSALGRANPGSTHNLPGGAGTVDVAPIPGLTFEQYLDGYRRQGYTVLYAKDEVKNPSRHATGPHWHVQLAGGPGAKPGKPGAVSPAQLANFDQEISTQLGGSADNPVRLATRAQTEVRVRAAQI
jgi:hypothetical protein